MLSSFNSRIKPDVGEMARLQNNRQIQIASALRETRATL